MTSPMQYHFAPRTIAEARRMRAVVMGYLIRKTWRRWRRRIADFRERFAEARQYRRDMAMLMQADARLLADIGLTRGDVRAAVSEGSFSRTLEASAARREQAMAVAQANRTALPRVHAPELAPSRINEMANAK